MAIVSVCVLTYNPDWIKFRNTLQSIICQKNVDFDIVVCDDGSKSDCFDKVKLFFKESDFLSYKLVKNVNNQGTVKNAIAALQHTDSKYVKLISPGDFLYDEYSLYTFIVFAEHNPAPAYFGNAYYYACDNNDIKIYDDKRNPHDITPWVLKDFNKIKRNYLYRSDFILGASLFCNRQSFEKYLLKLVDVVKYAEDMAVLLMIVDREQIIFIDKPIVFYEYGFGLSTNNSTKSKVDLDIDNLLYKLSSENKISKSVLILRKENSLILLISKFFIKLIVDPLSIINRLFPKDDKIHLNSKEPFRLLCQHLNKYF